MKEISLEIKELRSKTKSIREVAYDESVSYRKAQELREKEDEMYKKLQFLEGFVKAKDKVKNK